MSSASTMLNNYLATWEDFSIVWDLQRISHRLPVIPVLQRAYDFRKELLQSGPAILPWSEFHIPPETVFDEVSGELVKMYDKMAMIPLALTAWTRSSRRVFVLTPEMQHAFSHISVADIPLREITFPFDSFVIELANPIDDNGRVTSHLLISKIGAADGQNTDKMAYSHAVELLNKNILDYHPISTEKRAEAMQLRRRKSSSKIQKFLERQAVGRLKNLYRYQSPLVAFSSNSEYGAPRLLVEKGLRPSEALMIKIFLNLCLYLEALSGPEHEANPDRQWKRTGTRNRTEFIADEMEVCEIKGFHTLRALSEGQVSRHGAYEISEPHWRRGHKRRPPGKGRNPLAIKTVKVLPTLVRADLIPEYGLPVGAVTLVS